MVLINQLIGIFGKYQLFICFIIFLSRFGIAYYQMAIIFLAPPVHYKCPDGGTCCSDPIFDKSLFTKTIVTEWNLICERSWLKDFNQTVFQFGVLIGSVIFGIASDKHGRKSALTVAVIIEIFSGVISSFLPDYWSFTFVRMITGFAVGGLMVVSFVIVMEYVGAERRDLVSVLFHIPFTVGHITLAAFGYFIRDYTYFQLAISLVNVILLVYICILPETPRWLLAMNKTEEAVRLMERVAKVNNLRADIIREKIEEYQLEHRLVKPKGSILDLFRTPNMRRNILVMCYIWFTCSYCFYGMAHFISHVSGNIFVNVAISGFVCLSGCIISVPLIIFSKRKFVVIIANVACSVCLLTVAFLSEGKTSLVFGCAGIMCCYAVFIIVYLYCSEMFPTVVRNAALGICSMMARVGAMLAPFVVDLRRHGQWCAPVAFGVFPIVAALLCILLPETKDCELPMTLEEGEAFAGSQWNRTQNNALTTSSDGN